MFGGGGWKWFFLIAISTLAIGAIVLWGGLITTLAIAIKKEKEMN